MEGRLAKDLGLSAVAAACTLAPSVCLAQTQLWFAGWPHTTAGNGAISLNTNGELVVSNIGSSGLDGVSTDYPTSGSHHTIWTDFNTHDPNFGFEQVVTSAFADGSELATMRVALTSYGGSMLLIADTADITAHTHVRVTVFDEGAVRVGTVLKIDHRRDREVTMEDKLASVEALLD